MKKALLKIKTYFFLLFFSSFLVPNSLIAQHIPVNLGDNMTGSLDFEGDVQGYTFCSGAGVPIYLRASSDEIPNVLLELYDPSGDILVDGFSSLATTIKAETTTSGEYTVLVKALNSNGFGEFFISFQRTINPINGIPLVCNSSTMNNLSIEPEPKPYIFSVTAETSINITASSDDIPNVLLELYGPSGDIIDDDFSSLTAEIQITVSEAGCYTLFVMALHANGTGDFALAQNVTNGQCTSTCLTNEICDNGLDDDGDGLIDCQDEDCCNFYVLPIASIEGNLEFCEGESTILFANGGNSYLWSNGATNSSIVVSTPGTYSVTVTSGNNCIDSETVSVEVNTLPPATINGNFQFCEGEFTTLTAFPDNDVAYFWSTGETSQSIEVNAPNDYTVTVTDNNGCSNSTSIAVAELDLPTAIINGNTQLCEGEFSTLTASGGISYNWSTGVNVATINVITPGAYTVTVTGSNGCQDTETANVVVNPTPVLTYEGETQFCSGESTTIIVNGGTCNWHTGEETCVLTIDTPGNYGVTITNDNGCTNSDVISIFENAIPNVIITGDTDFCQGENTTLVASGANIYEWNTGATTSTITVSAANTYSVVGTSNNGCNNIDAVTTEIFDLPTVSLQLDQDTFCLDDDATLLNGGTPINGNFTGTGVLNNVFNPIVAGLGTHLITYSFTNNSGCLNTSTQELVVKNCTTSTTSAAFEESLLVYPNPTFGTIHIALDGWESSFQLKLFNINGQLIHQSTSTNNVTTLHHLTSGIYFLEISTSQFIVTDKIIVH